MTTILTREDAIAAGLKHYYTGKPCAKGHNAGRMVSNCGCLGCRAERKEENREKERAHIRASHQKHKEARNAAAKGRYVKNKPAFLDRAAEWAAANPEKRREICKRWDDANPENKRLHSSKRRARVRGAEGSHTVEDLAALLVAQKCKCANCRTSIKSGYEVDHIKPLALGGSHWIENIQLLCMPCNRSKGAKDPIEFAQLNGRLL